MARTSIPRVLAKFGGLVALAIEAKPVDVIAADVIIDLFLLVRLLAFFASGHHLSILLEHNRLSHLCQRMKEEGMSLIIFYNLLLRDFVFPCLFVCLFDEHMKRLLLSLGLRSPSGVCPIFFRRHQVLYN